jgi:hypothetical protein
MAYSANSQAASYLYFSFYTQIMPVHIPLTNIRHLHVWNQNTAHISSNIFYSAAMIVKYDVILKQGNVPSKVWTCDHWDADNFNTVYPMLWKCIHQRFNMTLLYCNFLPSNLENKHVLQSFDHILISYYIQDWYNTMTWCQIKVSTRVNGIKMLSLVTCSF